MYDDVINLIAIDERGNDVGEHEGKRYIVERTYETRDRGLEIVVR